MAADADVSVETIKRAKRVAKDAPEDVKQAVRDGKISVRKAAELIGDRKPKKAAKADPVGDDAHGDFDPVAELERLQAEVQTLQYEVKAAEADDAKAEVLKWRRIAEQAQRRQSELMGTVADREKKLQKLSQRMQRIGKLFGERDPVKIPALVESFYRAHAKVAA